MCSNEPGRADQPATMQNQMESNVSLRSNRFQWAPDGETVFVYANCQGWHHLVVGLRQGVSFSRRVFILCEQEELKGDAGAL